MQSIAHINKLKNQIMKIKLFLFTLFLCNTFASYGVELKKVSSGNYVFQSKSIITGKVFGDINDPLPGVSIYIKSLNISTATDYTGEFKLLNVPSGNYEITYTYLGFQDKTENITLKSGENLSLGNVVLSPSTKKLGEVVITSSIEGQQKAYNQQKNADNIKNVVSADLIGRFPDLNVAEALQRVSGVTIQRDNGEGSIVQIRGTPLNYTTVNINGEQIPSTDEGGNRSESLDLISADQLASMEISKAVMPEMDGDATGGSVNLITPFAKSEKMNVKATVGGGYNDLQREPSTTLKLNYDQRFFKNKLGFLAGGSYYNTINGEERIETIYGVNSTSKQLEINDFRLRPLLNTRKRTTLTSTIDYKFNDNSKIYFNALYSNLSDESVRNRVRIRPRAGSYSLTNPTIASGNDVEIRRDVNDRLINKSNLSLNLGGKHQIPGSNSFFDYELFYTGSERELTSRRHTFRKRNFTLNVDRSNPDFPLFSSPDFNFNDYSAYNFLSYEEDNPIANKGKNYVGKFNFTIPFKIKDKQGEFKWGAKYRNLSNERRRTTLVYDQLNGVYNIAQVLGNYNPSIFNNTYTLGFTPDAGAAQQYFNQNTSAFVLNQEQTRGLSDSFFFNATEEVSATYVQGKIQWGKLMVLAGLRFELTQVAYDANRVNRTPSGAWLNTTPVSGNNLYDFLLPSIHLRYSFDKSNNLRFAATKTYARPNFNDLVPNQDVNVFDLSLRSGNPNLVPASAVNVDLLHEMFFKDAGIISFGGFYKEISRFIFSQQSFVVGGEFDGFREEKPINGNIAIIRGLEFNASKKLDFLPGVLKGLSTFLNYTYADSKSSIEDRKNVRFPGQAKHIGNVALAFDYKKFSTRGTLNYNGNFVTSISSDSQFDFYTDNRFQLDVNASYKLNKRMTIYTEFVNLTNALKVEYQADRKNPINIESYGWSGRFGVNFKL